jgi:phage FluMu protein Com
MFTGGIVVADLKERVSYLKGLSSGLDVDPGSKDGKILTSVISVLEEFADTFSDLLSAQEELEDYVEELDEDLGHLEKRIYTGVKGAAEDEYVEVQCPRCHETLYFDAGILEDDDTVEVVCPNCDEVVFINDEGLQTADEGQELLGLQAPEDL